MGAECEVRAGEVLGNTKKRVKRAGQGVLLKGHPVTLGQNHLSVWVVPRDQDKWRNYIPSNAPGRKVFTEHARDQYGNVFTTFGAGPERENPAAWGRLISNFNRDRDVNEPKILTLQLDRGLSDSEQDKLIKALFDLDAKYLDNLNYDTLYPNIRNNNSYISGLLRAAGLPDIPLIGELPYPGWQKPVSFP